MATNGGMCAMASSKCQAQVLPPYKQPATSHVNRGHLQPRGDGSLVKFPQTALTTQ
jgi:hypothetical protein